MMKRQQQQSNVLSSGAVSRIFWISISFIKWIYDDDSRYVFEFVCGKCWCCLFFDYYSDILYLFNFYRNPTSVGALLWYEKPFTNISTLPRYTNSRSYFLTHSLNFQINKHIHIANIWVECKWILKADLWHVRNRIWLWGECFWFFGWWKIAKWKFPPSKTIFFLCLQQTTATAASTEYECRHEVFQLSVSVLVVCIFFSKCN